MWTMCNYIQIDADHNVWQCRACGHIMAFEADGPFENGIDFCPHCGKTIDRSDADADGDDEA